jgi:signal transduction histidine kinase
VKLVLPEEPTRLARKPPEDDRDSRPAEGEDLSRVIAHARTLASTLGPLLLEDDVLAAIGHVSIDHIADGCWVHLLEGADAKVAGAWQTDAVSELRLPADHQARLDAVLRTRILDSAGNGGSSGSMIVPLHFADRAIGGITLLFAASPFGPTERAMAIDLAMQAGAALGRSRIHCGVRKALTSRDDSFAAATHELGNPLNALRLQITALTRSTNLEPNLLTRILAMQRLVKQLVDLNRRMLDSSRLAAGQVQLRLEDVDLTAVVEDVLANDAEQLAWSNCPVSLSSPGPVIGRWDPLRLEQIVSNLVSNAMKYGHGGAISLSISVVAPGDRVRLAVHDEGVGIAMQDQERIFERFERASSAHASSSLGIGLWIVRQLVEAFGGTVGVESSLGAGATFTVELPRTAKDPGSESGGTTA